MFKLFIVSAASTLFLFAASLSQADEPVFEWKAGLLTQYFHYEEFNSQGNTLNQEEGLLPGLQFSLGYSTNRVRHQVQAEVYHGDVDYDGKTQGGIPHRTQTDTQLYHLGYRLDTGNTAYGLSAYFSADWHYWSRSIQPVGFIIGLDETYRWPSISLGLSYPLLHSEQHSLNFSAGYLRLLTGRFTVDLSELGFSKQEINLGSGDGEEASLLYRFRLDEKQSIELELYARRWSFQKSKPETISNSIRSITFVEPRSNSLRTGFALRFTAPF